MSRREKESSESKETNAPPTKGEAKIPVKVLFDKIYEKVDSPQVRKIAPEELKALKNNLDSALAQIEHISRKMASREEKPKE